MSEPNRYFLMESSVYHDVASCTALHRRNRYWPITGITLDEARRRRLRPCRLCSKGKAE